MDNFNIETTCAFTGHRILKKDFNEENLKSLLKEIIGKGYKTFLLGMAKGFDMKCFEILLSFNLKDIEIIACVPCDNQENAYSKEDKEKYAYLLSKANKVIKLNDEYFNGCMQIRNRYMVDNSSLLIAYMYAERGGTLYTVNYAKKKNKKIIFI